MFCMRMQLCNGMWMQRTLWQIIICIIVKADHGFKLTVRSILPYHQASRCHITHSVNSDYPECCLMGHLHLYNIMISLQPLNTGATTNCSYSISAVPPSVK